MVAILCREFNSISAFITLIQYITTEKLDTSRCTPSNCPLSSHSLYPLTLPFAFFSHFFKLQTHLETPVVIMTFDQIATRNLHALKQFDFPPAIEGTPRLPDGFPKILNSELAWTGNNFQKSSEYIQSLSEQDVLELESALQYFKCKLSPQSIWRQPLT